MRGLIPGGVTLLAMALLVGGAFAALLGAATGTLPATLADDLYLRRVVAFTFTQALLSTAISVGLAVPVARALARRERFPGRSLLIGVLGLPLVVPTVVAVLGIVAVYGRAGWLNALATGLGLPPWQHLYGLPGILIAHVFFNLPLAIRLLLPLWATVPGESWRLAAQLAMGPGAVWRLIEWPMLRQALPGVAGLVYMLCFTSFAVVLTLGGGPRATTIEVAIYQALRFEFEPARAVALALLELGCCALLVGLGQRLTRPMPGEPAPGRRYARPDAGLAGRIGDTLLIAIAALAVTLPLAAIAQAGVSGPVARVLADDLLWRAAATSFLIAISAAPLAVLGGWSLLLASRSLRLRHGRPRWADGVELSGSVVIVVPPIVIGTGLFIALSPLTDVLALAPLLVVAVNALMGLPYVIHVLGPQHLRVARDHDRLCASLGLRGLTRLRRVELPLLRRPIALALALTMALSLGDLGVIALFGTQDTLTLPLLIYQQMAGYRMEEAAVAALFLVLTCLSVFVVVERLIGGPR